MNDPYHDGHETALSGMDCEPPDHLSDDEKAMWEDGWTDGAAENPDLDVTWADAGHPDWQPPHDPTYNPGGF